MDYADINKIGDKIAQYLGPDETAIVIGFGAHKGTQGCPSGSMSVSVAKNGFEATSEAKRLGDAASLARGKVNRMIAADIKKREEEKEKAS